MAVVSEYGRPDMFITFTCNPKWKEIQDELLPRQNASDRPDLCARVFHMKLKHLLHLIMEAEVFGTVKSIIYVVEFQKRGLPHCHILIILHKIDRIETPEEVDNVVSAEIPPKSQPKLRELVLRHMVHGPCGILNPKSPCMEDGVCTKNYPKEFRNTTNVADKSYPEYRRRSPKDFGEIAIKRLHVKDVTIDNRWIVPHNPSALLCMEAHINIEIASSISVVKYLFKYIYKGPDRVMFTIKNTSGEEANEAMQSNVSPYRFPTVYCEYRAVFH